MAVSKDIRPFEASWVCDEDGTCSPGALSCAELGAAWLRRWMASSHPRSTASTRILFNNAHITYVTDHFIKSLRAVWLTPDSLSMTNSSIPPFHPPPLYFALSSPPPSYFSLLNNGNVTIPFEWIRKRFSDPTQKLTMNSELDCIYLRWGEGMKKQLLFAQSNWLRQRVFLTVRRIVKRTVSYRLCNWVIDSPSRLEISELCILGLSCAILRRWSRDQTMKAFMGRLMWSSLTLLPPQPACFPPEAANIIVDCWSIDEPELTVREPIEWSRCCWWWCIGGPCGRGELDGEDSGEEGTPLWCGCGWWWAGCIGANAPKGCCWWCIARELCIMWWLRACCCWCNCCWWWWCCCCCCW